MRRYRALIRSMLGLASNSPVVESRAVVKARRTAASELAVPAVRTVTAAGFKVQLDLTRQVQ
jgi:hypothetical protein